MALRSDRRARLSSILSGLVAAGLISAITFAFILVDLSREKRLANDRLDVAGQSLVEGMHRDLRYTQSQLMRSSSTLFDEPIDSEVRLASVSSIPFVDAVGHANSDDAPIIWLDEASAPFRSIQHAITERTSHRDGQNVYFSAVGEHLIMYHPYVDSGVQVWDVAIIDLQRLAESLVPTALDRGIVWDIQHAPGETPIATAETAVHREYLILDETTWRFELEWTDSALEALGVGIDWEGVIAGMTVAVAFGIVAAKWMRRRYVEADLHATSELLEQKDLLLKALSHQLRTPLTGVIGFLRLALEEGSDPMSTAQRVELAGLALHQAERAADLVEDMFVAARIQDTGVMTVTESVEIEPLVVRAFESSMHNGEDLHYGERSESMSMVVDPLRARQLFRNIFTSGREAGVTSWTVDTQLHGEAVVLSMTANAPIDPESPPLTPENVAMPEGMSAIGPRMEIAKKLCELMGGGLQMVASSTRTHIDLHFPRPSLESLEPATSQQA